MTRESKRGTVHRLGVLVTLDGEAIEALVADREKKTERLLMSSTYRVLADSDTGGATIEVPA